MPTSDTRMPAGIKPLLAQWSVERTGDAHIPGQYCPDRHVWMVGDKPIVETRSDLSEMSTKTEAQVERDDMSPTFLLELQTKTRAEAESDD